MDARPVFTLLLPWLALGCAPHAPHAPKVPVVAPTTKVPASVACTATAVVAIKPRAALQLVPAGMTIDVTFTPLAPFVDDDTCYRWPAHCSAGLHSGVYLYRPGEVLYYQYMPVGDYTMKVVVASLTAPEQKHEELLQVQLGADIAQVSFGLNNHSQAMLALRGEATQRYDTSICEGSGSGASLHSSSAHRIVCSVGNGAGVAWSMEGSSPRELYDYLQLQICSDGFVTMRHSQYAATFACQPADPLSPRQPGVLVKHNVKP